VRARRTASGVRQHRQRAAGAKILIGTLDDQGQPTGTTKTINVAGLSGLRSFTKAQLNAVGLVSVSDILGFQITATP
jgi:hypothetical protein